MPPKPTRCTRPFWKSPLRNSSSAQMHKYVDLNLMRFLLLVSFLILPSTVRALEISAEVNDLRPIFPLGLSITLTGPIENGDADRLRAVLSRYDDPDMRDISVELDSPGGSLVEGLEIAEVLRSRSEIVSAQVGSSARPQAECASACVLAYLGADLRYLAENGRIGVHQFGDPSGTVAADAAMNIAQRFASEIVSLLDRQRVSTDLFNRMANTPLDRISWVEKADLARWRVVTGPIFDERMEYKNANGKVALHMVQESLYGTNQMTLICGDNLVAYAVLEEPELAMLGWFSLVIDGEDNRISDTELLNRDNARTRFLMRVPDHISSKMITARSIGARVHTPGGDVFWGFDQTIRDTKVQEMAESCITPTSGGRRMHILPATDLIGSDLTQNGIRGISFQECQQICLDAPKCQAISYVSEKLWCWPKGTIGPQNAAPGIMSAVK